ncbi:unnamed protein product [Closterium sp. Naga37s-1]|nr:unnamed protein product [Closterium sp. Naga37s-1]
MGDVVPGEQLSAEERSRPVTKADAARAEHMESMSHGGPVKGGTAAALQSAADKNVQAGVVPPMWQEGGMGAAIRMGDVVPPGEQLSAEEKSRPVTKADAARAEHMESMTHGGPVKGGAAAALQSAADKNVQAGVVPAMAHEKAAARVEATGAGAEAAQKKWVD